MGKLKQLVGRVKNNPGEDWRGMEGLTLIVLQFEEDEQLTVIRPISLEEMERFYRISYENTMKDMISDDYDYCIWYLLDEACELTCQIHTSDLEDIRETTEDDVAEHNKNLEEFKKIHKGYEYQKKLEDEEKEVKEANDEFKKEQKTIVKVLMGDKKIAEVEAVIYKGFAIHNSVGDIDDNPYKTISVLHGEFEGMKIASCRISKCKKLIDEIRGVVGDRTIVTSDAENIRKIVARY